MAAPGVGDSGGSALLDGAVGDDGSRETGDSLGFEHGLEQVVQGLVRDAVHRVTPSIRVGLEREDTWS